ncbi:unnamed protein product [Scytosiphon promiscuus]
MGDLIFLLFEVGWGWRVRGGGPGSLGRAPICYLVVVWCVYLYRGTQYTRGMCMARRLADVWKHALMLMYGSGGCCPRTCCSVPQYCVIPSPFRVLFLLTSVVRWRTPGCDFCFKR